MREAGCAVGAPSAPTLPAHEQSGLTALAGRIFMLVLCLPLALAAYVGLTRISENFDVVEPGVLYRSAQLDAEGLARVARQHGIRSVFMVRGGGPGDAWFEEEQEATQRLGLHHEQYRLSARRDVSPERLEEILSAIERAPKPVLVHCNAGADRTGLVAAGWLLRRGHAAQAARRQLSLRYGYFPYFGNPSQAMMRSFQSYHLALAAPRPERMLGQAATAALDPTAEAQSDL